MLLKVCVCSKYILCLHTERERTYIYLNASVLRLSDVAGLAGRAALAGVVALVGVAGFAYNCCEQLVLCV